MSNIHQELIDFDFPAALEEALGLNSQARNSLFELFEEAMKADLHPEQASMSLIKALDATLLSYAHDYKYADLDDRQQIAQMLAYWTKFRASLLKEALYLLNDKGRGLRQDHNQHTAPAAAARPTAPFETTGSQGFQPHLGAQKAASQQPVGGFRPTQPVRQPVPATAPAQTSFKPTPPQAKTTGFNRSNLASQQQRNQARVPSSTPTTAPVFQFGAPKG